MDMFVAKLQRDPSGQRCVLLKIPLELLSMASIDPWSEVVMQVDGPRILLEAINQDIDQMEMFAEDFVGGHLDALRALGDDPCR